MFDLSGDYIAHISKNRPSINLKQHQLLAHHLNIHIVKTQKNTQQYLGLICCSSTCYHLFKGE